MSDVDTTNDFLIGTNGTQVAPALPLLICTRQQAYRAAAYIKLMGLMLPDEEPASTYQQVETAIGNT